MSNRNEFRLPLTFHRLFGWKFFLIAGNCPLEISLEKFVLSTSPRPPNHHPSEVTDVLRNRFPPKFNRKWNAREHPEWNQFKVFPNLFAGTHKSPGVLAGILLPFLRDVRWRETTDYVLQNNWRIAFSCHFCIFKAHFNTDMWIYCRYKLHD